MYEKKLKELSQKIGEDSLKNFYILTHKKHDREIYFQNNKKAINLIEDKLNSPLRKFRRIKKIVYSLIKIRILQPFLKKVKLSSKFGDVIYVANQIKGFDLANEKVISFPSYKKLDKDFIKSKIFQMKIAKKGFAPEILEINKDLPYSNEELLESFSPDLESIFKKLNEFYNFIGIKKISVKKYVSSLKKSVKDDEILEKLDKLSDKDFKILITTLHGDVAIENVLQKGEKIVLIDWDPYIGPITNDLFSFFQSLRNSFSFKEFKSALEFYPNEVRKNLKSYLILSEISLKLRKR